MGRPGDGNSGNAADKATVIIVTYKGDGLLEACLDSMERHCAVFPETVVVDNANLESTRALVSRHPGVSYIPLDGNRGFAGGSMAAYPSCGREYVILLNNDTVLTGDAVTPLVEFMDSHPACAAAQGKVVLASNGETDGCGAFLSPLGILAFSGAEDDFAHRVFAVGGAFFIARRSAVDAAGGLFHAHFGSYYEEIDLSCRLAVAGFECWYAPVNPPVLHAHSATAGKVDWRGIRRRYYRNIWFSTLTCFGPLARLRLLVPITLLSCLQSLAAAVKLDFWLAKAHIASFLTPFRERRLVAETRKKIASFRKRTDRQILSFAIRRQKFSYYRNLMKRG